MIKSKNLLPPFRNFKSKLFLNNSQVSKFIYQADESPILRNKSLEIPVNKIISLETKTKNKYLTNCLKKYRKITGVGRAIAAVQVGIPEKIAAVFVGGKAIKSINSQDIIIIINPKIISKSKQKLLYPEMCMSAFPIIAPVVRPSWIKFEYYNESGELKIWDTKDDTDFGTMMNRVFQHEIDHMEGILNIDLVKNPRDLKFLSNPEFYNNAKFEVVE